MNLFKHTWLNNKHFSVPIKGLLMFGATQQSLICKWVAKAESGERGLEIQIAQRIAMWMHTAHSVCSAPMQQRPPVADLQGAAKKMTQHQKCDNSVKLENFCAKFCVIV